MAFNLKLPDERGKQLQMIADAEGKSVVDVITDHIRAKVASGVIPADLPFVEVNKTASGVSVAMPGFDGDVPAGEVPALTDALREAGARLTPADVERKQRLIEGLAELSGIKVKRMAQGVRLVSSRTGKEYPLAFGVAADLADQIDRTAK
ncbi:MAG: hypothetical protein ACLGIE_06105 [Alphaproteobacteria bacterium]